ncbi:MAG: cytochrome P450 [Acidobacteriota bacterium]|nr:cytochrome P450 [Acidobacteriota bacterium]
MPDTQFIDFTDPEFIDNPYPFYKRLREDHPVYWMERPGGQGSWLISRYEDVSKGLKSKSFSAGGERGTTTLNVLPPEERAEFQGFISLMKKFIMFLDQPKHTKFRKLANKGFTKRNLEPIEAYIQKEAETLIAEIQKKGKAEFQQEYATLLPAMVITEMLGAPQSTREEMVARTNDLAHLLGMGRLTRERLMEIKESYHALHDYFEKHIAELRANPKPNILSALITAQEENTQFTDDQLYANSVGLMLGGHETTRNLLMTGLYNLLIHPDQLQLLRDHPDLLYQAVEEMTRYDSPLQFVGRIAGEDMEMHGQNIAKGDHILFLPGSANRDPSVFENPDEFDIQRDPGKPVKHLAYGAGPHLCLGAPLARMEAHITFRLLLDTFSTIELVPDQKIEWINFPVLRGLVRLDVTCS